MSYSIEIFTDENARGDIDLTPALGGIALLEKNEEFKTKPIVGNTLNITTRPGPEIYTNRIKWPRNLEADLNILLTDRRVTSPNSKSNNVNRLGIVGTSRDISKLAIISTLAPVEVATEVVAHELGHLIEVYGPRKHCKNADCIMFKEIRTKTVEVADTSHFINVVRKLVGVPSMKKVEEYDPQSDFCDDCSIKVTKQLQKLRMFDL